MKNSLKTSDLVSYSVLEIAAVFEGLNDQILTYYLKGPKIEKVKEYEWGTKKEGEKERE